MRVRAPHPSHAAPPAAAPAAHRSLRIRAECRVGAGAGGTSGQGQGQGRGDGGGRKRGPGVKWCVGVGRYPHAVTRTRTRTHANAPQMHARDRLRACGGVWCSASQAARLCRDRSPPRLRLLVAAARRRGARDRRPAPAPQPEPPSAAQPYPQSRRGLRPTVPCGLGVASMRPVLRPACGIHCPCREELVRHKAHNVQRVLD